MASSPTLGIFPGSFNPPTNAHLALIRAAAREVDRVLAVIPRTFPHKSFDGATLEDRLAMLEAARSAAPFDISVTEGGLFVEIARECRATYGQGADLWFVCGRDAAQRIVEWDYGHPKAIHRMLDEFGLLVASRQGEYSAPEELKHRIRALNVPPEVDTISATKVRERIKSGEPWQHMVPAAAVPLISRVYGRRP